jgi:hypothetical protein
MLSKTDKKLAMNMVTWLDEEIEQIGEDEPIPDSKQTLAGANKGQSKKSIPLLPKQYILALISYLILGFAFLFVVVNHIESTAHLPDDFNV